MFDHCNTKIVWVYGMAATKISPVAACWSLEPAEGESWPPGRVVTLLLAVLTGNWLYLVVK